MPDLMASNSDSRKNHGRSAWWLVAAAGVGLVALAWAPSAADRDALVHSLALGGLASLVGIPVGVMIHWVIQFRGWMPRLLEFTTLTLLFLPLFVQVSCWDAAFGKLGWWSTWNGNVLQPLASGWVAAVWIHGLAAAPQVAAILWIGKRLDRRIWEEQALLEASRWQVFLRVTVPRSLPLLGISALWILVSVAREIVVADLYQIGTIAEQIYLGYALLGTADVVAPADGLWLSITLTCFGFLALALFLLLISMEDESESRGEQAFRGSWRRGPQWLGAGLCFLLLFVPAANVIARASFRVRAVAGGSPVQEYTLAQLVHSIERSAVDYQAELGWSFLIAVTAASGILVVGLIWSFQARTSRWARWSLIIGLAVCGALPGPVLGSGLDRLFSMGTHPGWHYLTDYTIFGPVVANSLFCWPIGGILVWWIIHKTPRDTLESATLDGASGWQRFWQLGIRANLWAISGCWLILLSVSFGELAASQMVRPPGMDTVSRKMLGDLHAGVNELTAGITIVTTGLVAAITWVGYLLIRLHPGARRQQ